MRKHKDISVNVPVPALSRRCVMYLGKPEVVASALENGQLERACAAFSAVGYRFIYAPGLVEGVSGAMAEYLFPGFELPAAGWVSARLLERIGCPGKSGFLYRYQAGIYFREIGKDFDKEVRSLAEFLEGPSGREYRTTGGILGSLGRHIYYARLDQLDSLEAEYDREVSFSVKRRKKAAVADEAEAGFVPETEPELDEETRALLREIDRFLEKHHLTLEELEILLGYTVKLSPLRVDRNGRIFMTEFGNKEVKMDHLTKMVYLFFLRHPEGMRMKEVSEHQEELLGLYMQITGRDALEKIKESIARHTDPFGPNLNISASRIRKAFKDLVGEKVARFYWLEGSRGELYSIKLDRDYVIWQYP